MTRVTFKGVRSNFGPRKCYVSLNLLTIEKKEYLNMSLSNKQNRFKG